MLSHVYRLSAENDANAKAIDDRNVLLWRASRRRDDAEVLRDSVLFVSGDLDLAAGGRTIRKISQYDLGYEFDTVRRSVYVPAFRNSMLDIFEVFDFANPNLVIGHRNTSTLPTQALFLMNNPMLIKQSRNMAKRILAMPSLDGPQRIEMAYRISMTRKPSPIELQSATKYIESLANGSDEADQVLAAWSSYCHALLASLDFRYVD